MLHIKIKYSVDLDTFEVYSTEQDERVVEVLEQYARYQIGLSPDTREAAIVAVYDVDIGFEDSDRSFHVTANTGNDGLTLGIVMKYLRARLGAHS